MTGGFKNMNADQIIQCILALMLKLEKSVEGIVEDQIVDGVTTKAPSQNIVYDALAGIIANFPKFKIKLEDSFDYAAAEDLIGENQVVPISADGKASIVLENSGLLSLGGINYDNITNNSAAEIPHPGKPYFIFNATGNPVTLKHMIGVASEIYKPFWFSNEEDMSLPPNGMAEFKLNDTTNTLDKIPGGAMVINDLVTGGPTDALSAEMGVFLKSLIDAIFQPNTLISSVPPTRSVNTFTYPANQYTVLINKTIRTNPSSFITVISAASTADHKRVDLIYFKDDNTLVKVVGTESLTVAPRPDIPVGIVGVPISFINVFGNVISDPTPVTQEISIQDSLGVERFKVTDYLRFRGVSFDPSLKQISIEAFIPFTVFVDTVNGDDSTGQIENKAKPFKTDNAAYNALPIDDGTDWTISFIDLNATRIMSSKIPNRNIIIECNNTGVFDFSSISSGFISLMTSNKKFSFNAPNCEFRYVNNSLVTAVYFTNGISELNINCSYLNISGNGTFDGNFFVSSKTIINITTIRMNYVAKLFTPLNASSVLDATINRLEIFKGTLSLFYNNYITINMLYSTITNRSLIYSQFSPSTFDITVRGVDSLSSGDLYFVSGIATGVLKLYDFKIPALLNLICTGPNFYTEGNLTSDSKAITILNGAANFKLRNFTGKLPLINFSVDTSVTWVLENSVINVPPTFIDAQNVANKGNIDFKIFNSVITQDTPSQIFKNVNPTGNNFKITQTGSFATNATSIGRNVSLVFSSLTFKEKSNEIIIRDKIDIVNKVLSSSIKYIIDGSLTLLTGEYIEVPAGGLDLGGYGFDTSSISKNVTGQSIFISPSGNSGNFVSNKISFYPGVGSVFNLTDSNGTHAIELNDINFQGVAGSSLGTLNGFRQFTGTTCGFYGLSDGITLEGNWSGFKLTNSNVIGFGATGTLFKKGTATVFSNRFYIDLNLQIATGSKICDFAPANFTNDKSLQVVNCYAKVNGVINDTTTSATFPNITPYSSKSYFVNNIGIKNSNQMPYGIATTNMQTYLNDADAAAGGIVQIGETYIETTTGYFKKRLT